MSLPAFFFLREALLEGVSFLPWFVRRVWGSVHSIVDKDSVSDRRSLVYKGHAFLCFSWPVLKKSLNAMPIAKILKKAPNCKNCMPVGSSKNVGTHVATSQRYRHSSCCRDLWRKIGVFYCNTYHAPFSVLLSKRGWHFRTKWSAVSGACRNVYNINAEAALWDVYF